MEENETTFFQEQYYFAERTRWAQFCHSLVSGAFTHNVRWKCPSCWTTATANLAMQSHTVTAPQRKNNSGCTLQGVVAFDMTYHGSAEERT